jgi:hypothetical protein
MQAIDLLETASKYKKATGKQGSVANLEFFRSNSLAGSKNGPASVNIEALDTDNSGTYKYDLNASNTI